VILLITGRVLLLNFSYEPLGTVGVARAVCLWFRGKVSVEEYDGENVLRSPSQTINVPSVIRLRSYINVRSRRQETAMKRARIYIRDKYRCQYCGDHRHAQDLTLDHITPRAQGGESTPQNLVTACVACNQRKGNRTPEQARMPLLCSQKLLSIGLDHVLLCHYAESKPEWKKYLFMEDFDVGADSSSVHLAA
jgi:5-methylcytosine-specific restriction endonuclease McrA